MIAITFALPAESSQLVISLRNERRVACGDTEIIYGEINCGAYSDYEPTCGQLHQDYRLVAIFHTGVGTSICATRIDHFLNAEKPTCLMSSGFAGAVCEDFQVGNLILAENFSDRQLLVRATQVLGDRKPRVATLFTSKTIVDSIAERGKIAREQDAQAVDMETEVIAQACSARGIPMLSIRAISDSPREPLPAPSSVLFDLGRQRTSLLRLAGYFIVRPMAVRRVIRFGRQIKRAEKVLKKAIVDLVRALAV
jgi:nucleoside phosphorylase